MVIMPAHDGPISEGIRDAIRESGMTPYAIAKEVTKGGKVKLTGPQIYRFLNNKKGLSLAILDEIALVLGLAVQTLPPGDRRSRHSPYRVGLQEQLDRMSAVAVDESVSCDDRITALDRLYNSICREKLCKQDEVSILFSHLNTLKDRVRREANRSAPPPSTVVVRRSVKERRKPAIDIPDDEDDEWIGGEEPDSPPGPFRIKLPRPKSLPEPIDDAEDDVDADEDDEEWFG